jgi:hypothetical protein
VNAFVHSDCSGYSGGLRVTMLNRRIDIWKRSPADGLTPAELRVGHPSILIKFRYRSDFRLREPMERNRQPPQT